MQHEIDYYAGLDSPIHRWEPRCKLIGLMALIFAFSAVEVPGLLLVMLLVTGILYKLSRLPGSYLRQRLHYPGYFLLGAVVMLPLSMGETVLLDLGWLQVRWEGILAAIPIVVRFVCIVTVTLVLFGTGSLATSLRAMRSLGVPSLITDMMLLFYRYLYDLLDRLRQVQTAMRLRGFNPKQFSWRTLRLLAALTGTLLVTSYEQSEQVYQAMRLRGYGQRPAQGLTLPIQPWDAIALGGVLLLAAGLVIAQIWLSLETA
ncbi:cobalt ECF transporter T component CbiQ [Phormidium yuhuli AB48]|uniref:Cobalt ECF transporter T component CbiQ n=1 Tax=Phormidium yuhuli AB48 TaxID=2940671 RepID=A0ABY5AKT2_9CYAN|nr:cobalt ECF transporter T component CbiQ [Phormidium yuhuli]USR89732.1 cobalt ECF transporter T component CbiQ [Phormidium yuhuli AB48]